MKLSTKIFLAIVIVVACHQITSCLLMSILISPKEITPYKLYNTPLQPYKRIEIGKNWSITLFDTAKTGASISTNDPEIADEAMKHIEVRNNTLYFHDIDKNWVSCNIHIEPLLEKITTKGNSYATINLQSWGNQVKQIRKLDLQTYDRSMIQVSRVLSDSLTVHIHDKSTIKYYSDDKLQYNKNDFVKDNYSITKAIITDYGTLEVVGLCNISKYEVKGHGLLKYYENIPSPLSSFAASADKRVSLKTLWTQ